MDQMACLPGTSIEVIHADVRRGRVCHAVFDFDGTLSLVREGWPDVMVQLFVAVLMQTPWHEGEAEVRKCATELVEQSTGEQTVDQMRGLADEVRRRGGRPADPNEYKRQYLERLRVRLDARFGALLAGQRGPADLVVPGACEFVASLKALGVKCYIASGTDEAYVRQEAAALGLASYFAEIHGARDGAAPAAKRRLFEQIVRQHGLQGPELAVFGDGPVEIAAAKSVGALAIGLATDEARRCGVDARKRARLMQAGADVIVPDFRDRAALMAYLFPAG